MPMLSERIGLIGAGQMATALGRGFVRSGALAAGKLIAADPSPEARGRFAAETGGGLVTESNLEAVAQADVLFLAVKPQQLGRVMAELREKSRRGNWSCRSSPGPGWQRWPKGLARRCGWSA